jgi:hypothetical protein
VTSKLANTREVKNLRIESPFIVLLCLLAAKNFCGYACCTA